MLAIAAVGPLTLAVVTRLGAPIVADLAAPVFELEPFYPVIVASMVSFGPAIYGFVVGMFVLKTAEQGVLTAYRVSPLLRSRLPALPGCLGVCSQSGGDPPAFSRHRTRPRPAGSPRRLGSSRRAHRPRNRTGIRNGSVEHHRRNRYQQTHQPRTSWALRPGSSWCPSHFSLQSACSRRIGR